jgi:ornithine carbamoyltransferase
MNSTKFLLNFVVNPLFIKLIDLEALFMHCEPNFMEKITYPCFH